MNVDGEDDAEAGAADGDVTLKQGPPTLVRVVRSSSPRR
jgi:hypothetical protein